MGNNYRDIKNKVDQLWWKVKGTKLEKGFEEFLECLTEQNKNLFIECSDESMVEKYKFIEERLRENRVDLVKIRKDKMELTQKIEAMVDLLYEELKIDNDFSKIYDFYYELKDELVETKRYNLNFYDTTLKVKIDYIFTEERKYRVKRADEIAREIETDKVVYVDDSKKRFLYKRKSLIEDCLLDISNDMYTKKIRKVLSFISAIEINNQRLLEKKAKKQREEKLKVIKEENERLERDREDKLRKKEEDLKRQRLERKKLEAEKKEEIKRIEAKKEKKIKLIVGNLKISQILSEDYLNADEIIEKRINTHTDILSETNKRVREEYRKKKNIFIKGWILKNTRNKSEDGIQLDDEQAEAVGAVGSNYLVSARAGSGKTRVLISRAFFLIKHCNIPANEILILAFNKKAVQEVNKRLIKLLGNNIPVVQTFHALAYKIAKPEENLLYDQDTDKTHSIFIDKLIKKFISKNENVEKIKDVMLRDFGDEWKILLESKYTKGHKELLKYRRSLVYESIDGKYIKSYGEKLISNFLFEHDIEYSYERNHTWNGLNYKPDFTILFNDRRSGIVIEYFGMEGVKSYDITTEEKINYWNEKERWNLIEIYPRDVKGDIESILTSKLNKNGIRLKRLTEEEIWEKIKEPTIKKFTNIVKSFIGQCRKKEIKVRDLEQLIDEYQTKDEIELKFYLLCKDFYSEYLNLLKEDKNEDFDGLLERAIGKIEKRNSIFRGFSKIGEDKVRVEGDIKNLKYIFIDEFQDFSKLFYSLIKSIKKINDSVDLFCVGDDWQAINGFAGSDLEFFKEFKNKFENTEKLKISKNYRSKIDIVDIGNKLQKGNGDEATAYRTSRGNIKLVHVDEFKPTPIELQRHKGDYITPLILRIISKNIDRGKKVMLISRKNSLPYYTHNLHNSYKNNELNNFLESIRSQIVKEKRHMITINTTHKSKGLEETVVILLDVDERNYPLIHPHWKYSKILGKSIENIVEEEKRLLYVGLTRAEDSLYLITGINSKSPMLEAIEKIKRIENLNFKEYTPIKTLEIDNKRVLVRVYNSTDFRRQGGGTYPIKEILKKYKYHYNSREVIWEKIYKKKTFEIDKLLGEEWVNKAKNVDIVLKDEEDREIKRINIGQDGSIR